MSQPSPSRVSASPRTVAAGRGTGRGVSTVAAPSSRVSTVTTPAGAVSSSPPARRLPPISKESPGAIKSSSPKGSSPPEDGVLTRASESPMRIKPSPPAKLKSSSMSAGIDPAPSSSSSPPSQLRSGNLVLGRKSPPTEPSSEEDGNSNHGGGSASRKNTRMSVFVAQRTGPPPEIQGLPTAVAMEDYDAENHRELSFKKDDVIHVVFWNATTSWWKGWLNGQVGYFPRESVNQSFVDDAPTTSVVSKADSADKKRKQLISSISTSEEIHVKDLQLIQDVITNLQTVLTPAEISEIFGNIETIVQESKNALNVFLRKARTEEPIGDVFLRMAQMFEEHLLPWAHNQVNMLVAIERLNASNSGVAACLLTIAEQCRGLSLYEWLAKPTRRVGEFHQITGLILTKTPQTHPDYAPLQQTNEIMVRVKEALKQPLEDFENLMKIVALQNSLQGQESLVAPGRKFVREYLMSEIVGKKTSERKFVLLTDLLVVVKTKRTGFGQGVFYPWSRISVAPISDSGSLKGVWELTATQSSSKKEKTRYQTPERDSFLKMVDQLSAANSAREESSIPSGAHGPSSPQSLDTLGKKSQSFIKILRPSQRSFSVSDETAPNIQARTSSKQNLLPDAVPAPTALAARPSAASPGGASKSVRSLAVPSAGALSSTPIGTRRSEHPDRAHAGSAAGQPPFSKSVTSPGIARNGMVPAERGTRPASMDIETGSAPSSSLLSASAPSLNDANPFEEDVGGGSGVICSKCQEIIVGNALNIKSKYYHNDCYKCSNCDVSLLIVPYAEKRGIPYCKDCAISMFAEPCAGCGKMITGAYLAAFGVKYHPACFLCAGGCGKNVSNGYANRNGKAYCKVCVKALPREPKEAQ